jgi:acetylornithine deacetylase
MPHGHRFTLGQQDPYSGAPRLRAAPNNRINRTFGCREALQGWLHHNLPVTEHSSPARALVEPNRVRMRADLDELIAVPSMGGTPAEVSVQELLAKRWRDWGWDVRTWEIDLADLTERPDFPGMEVDRDRALGVMAVRSGSGGAPTLMLNGHTDVVPPGDLSAWSADPFEPRRVQVDGRECVVGRGACDMKGGLVAAWEALRMIDEAGITLRGNVVLCPVSGEEDGGLGTFAALDHLHEHAGLEVDACIVPEPTDLDIVPANGGALTFRLRVPGAAIHASRRAEGVSAIEKFLPILQALTELEGSRNAVVDPLMSRWPIAYPLSIGTVRAGDWASTVPDLLVAEGRLGVALDESMDAARAALESAVAQACDSDAWLRDHPVSVEWWGGQFASGRTADDAPIVSLVRDAHTRATGRTPSTYGGPYGSDLRLLTGIAGIPTVQYGPGDTIVAHAPNEFVAIDDVVTCASVIADVIVQYCS